MPDAQAAFDAWRAVFNHERPHQALDYATPIERYRASPRAFPETLAPIVYSPDDLIVRPDPQGWIKIHGCHFLIPNILFGNAIGVRADPNQDGLFNHYFCHHRFMRINLNQFR